MAIDKIETPFAIDAINHIREENSADITRPFIEYPTRNANIAINSSKIIEIYGNTFDKCTTTMTMNAIDADICSNRQKVSSFTSTLDIDHRFVDSIAINVVNHSIIRQISTHTLHHFIRLIRINVNASIVENITNQLEI